MLPFRDIPEDLEEMLYEEDIMCGTFSNAFDKAMLDNGLFEYGSLRRSHRHITKKSQELGYLGVISLLTGLTIECIEFFQNEEKMNIELDEMFAIAKKYGYKVEKIDE